MVFELEGRVKKIFDKVTFKSGFSKRELLVHTFDWSRPQDVKFEALGDKASILEKLRPDDPVKVKFEIRGSEYNGKYFNNLIIKNIERGGSGYIENPIAGEDPSRGKPAFEGVDLESIDAKFSDSAEEDDDLPF